MRQVVENYLVDELQMVGYIDYVLHQHIVMKVMVKHDHVGVRLMEKKDNIKMVGEMNHWKELVGHLIMMDIFHDDSIVDQIEMMVNDYHNNLIDYYLFDYVMKVGDHHYEDDDNVSMDHFGMK